MTAPAGVSGADIVKVAAQQLGDAYDFGATGPDRWDCSSLVQHAYRQMGIDLPRVTYDQVAMPGLQVVSLDKLQPGDLVFSDWGDGRNSHVGLYAGNDRILEAGTGGVAYEQFGPGYRGHVTAARRVPGVVGYSGTGRGVITDPTGVPSPGDVLGWIGEGVGNIVGAAPDPLGALNRIGDGIAGMAGGMIKFGQVNAKILDLWLHPQRAVLKATMFFFGLIFILIGIWLISKEIRD